MSNARKLRSARAVAAEAGEVLEKLFVSYGHTYSKRTSTEVRIAISRCKQQAAALEIQETKGKHDNVPSDVADPRRSD